MQYFLKIFFKVLVLVLILHLNMATLTDRKLNKFQLLTLKERMELIRSAILKYGSINEFDDKYGVDELVFYNYFLIQHTISIKFLILLVMIF